MDNEYSPNNMSYHRPRRTPSQLGLPSNDAESFAQVEFGSMGPGVDFGDTSVLNAASYPPEIDTRDNLETLPPRIILLESEGSVNSTWDNLPSFDLSQPCSLPTSISTGSYQDLTPASQPSRCCMRQGLLGIPQSDCNSYLPNYTMAQPYGMAPSLNGSSTDGLSYSTVNEDYLFSHPPTPIRGNSPCPPGNASIDGQEFGLLSNMPGYTGGGGTSAAASEHSFLVPNSSYLGSPIGSPMSSQINVSSPYGTSNPPHGPSVNQFPTCQNNLFNDVSSLPATSTPSTTTTSLRLSVEALPRPRRLSDPGSQQILPNGNPGSSGSRRLRRINSASSKPRGKRIGPMLPADKENSNETRRQRNKCSICHLAKIKCSGGRPCVGCHKGFDGKDMQMCYKARFIEIVREGTTFPIESVSESPLTSLLQHVRDLSEGFNSLDVYYGTKRIYSVDLYAFAKFIHSSKLPSDISFETFLSKYVPKPKGKLNGLRELGFDQLGNCIGTFVQWIRVLGYTKLFWVPKDSGGEALLESSVKELIATQIALTQLRRVEHAVYHNLSRIVRNPSKERDPDMDTAFIELFGLLLLCLRWQICVSNCCQSLRLEDESYLRISHDRQKRVEEICNILYPYFDYCRGRLGFADGSGFVNTKTFYGNMTNTIRERFPTDSTTEGRETWLRDGESSIRNSQIPPADLPRSIGLDF